MAELIVVYWRDIPSQVIARSGRRSGKRMLSDRFQEAIDRCAMRVRASDEDAYLADWRKQPVATIEAAGSDALDAAAEERARALETEFDAARLDALVRRGGLEDTGGG